MFNSDVLEVATGVVLVYLLMSAVATSGRELLESLLKTRGKALELGLVELFKADDPASAGAADLKTFYEHPLIYSLYRGDYKTRSRKGRRRGRKNLPSYIPSASFALALIDIVARQTNARALTPAALETAVDAFDDGQIKQVLKLAIQTGGNDLAKIQTFLETWYDATMDRVSGLYRRQTQTIIFWMGLLLCVGLNVNTIIISDALYQDSTLRLAVVAQADAAVKRGAPRAGEALDTSLSNLGQADLPIGWTGEGQAMAARLVSRGPFGVAELVAGWIMTAFAVTLGAPFWFDVLNRFTVVRSTVKPAEKSGKEASKDP